MHNLLQKNPVLEYVKYLATLEKYKNYLISILLKKFIMHKTKIDF